MYQAPTHYSTSLSFYGSNRPSVDNYDGNQIDPLPGLTTTTNTNLDDRSNGDKTAGINDNHQDFFKSRSSQSLESYTTAQLRLEPSFTSINKSILQGNSDENINDGDNHQDGKDEVYNNDQTPKLNIEGYLQDRHNGFNENNNMFNNNNLNRDPGNIYDDRDTHEQNLKFDNGISHSNSDNQLSHQKIENDSTKSSAPLQELSSKFNRLSVTLRHSKTSLHSYEFMNMFQSKTQEKAKMSQDSFPENNSKGHRPRYSNSDIGESSQSSINSTRIMEEDIPIRKDLVQKYEQLSTVNDPILSSKLKNDIYIESARGNQLNLSDTVPHGLNIVTSDNLNTSNIDSNNNAETNETDLSSLFIRALHSFDANTLQSELDASICLSFEKDDLAFVHLIDESGWGEVTLVNSLSRGWIPMNYFSIVINEDESNSKPDLDNENDDQSQNIITNIRYLKTLFHACGKFLTNPLSEEIPNGEYTFSLKTISSIRDGVRLLLQFTDCLSRSNEIVSKRPLVRKSRKALLADWYSLMVKAKECKGSTDFKDIEELTLIIYRVISKAMKFLNLWSIESLKIVKRESGRQLKQDMKNYPLLNTPPLAKSRIMEINGLLFKYLSIIIGRLDLVEHNRAGCDMLENLTHQVILLLRELLFISRNATQFSKNKPYDLDTSLDDLLSLSGDFVEAVKAFVLKTIREKDSNASKTSLQIANDYYYTQEGGNLIHVALRIITSISKTISSIFKLLEVTGDFKLSSERSYPDYFKMKIEPEDFIKTCALSIVKSNSMTNIEAYKSYLPKEANNRSRYSMIRSGKSGQLGITPDGAGILRDVLIDQDGSSPFSISNAEFQPFNIEDNNVETDIQNELLVDNNGNLLGASFKGLVYTLTNENSPPDYFFVSTFFICYKSFASALDLTEELITRFDVSNKFVKSQTKNDISLEVKIKNRRRLIVKMFQSWMESYWNQEKDQGILTTLINFFNEGVTLYLPIEATKLIDIAVRLSTRPLVENEVRPEKRNMQLVTRSIAGAKTNRKSSFNHLDRDLSSRYSMVDDYELSKINTNSSATSSVRSMALPMPLGVGNQTSSSNGLLSRNQLNTIEQVNLTYRGILGTCWCAQKYIDTTNYVALDLRSILPKWYIICDQSWVLSNYRPNLLDFNGLEIAKQLTLIESQIFCSIKPDELLNENFTSKRAYLKLAPNVRLSLLFTNCLSSYVLESILQPDINQKTRVNMIKTWLKIAISCLYLRNFNSLAAIITALQSHLITRLDQLWVDLSSKYKELYDYLLGLIHPEKNYLVYRTKLRKFLKSNDYNIPIVPYFSLFLQDLTFLTDGNPKYRKANTFLNQKLINIDKYLKITRIIADIESLQIPYTSNNLNADFSKRSSKISFSSLKSGFDDYSIIPLPSLQEFILLELWKVGQVNKHEDDRAWKLSLNIQPR